MPDVEYTPETAYRIKTELENRINNNNESIKAGEMQRDAADYLKLECGLFRVNHVTDADCNDIPPHKRESWQIIRDLDNTTYYTPDESGLARRFVDEVCGWYAYNTIEKQWYCWTGNCWRPDTLLDVDKFPDILKDQLFFEKPANMYLEEIRSNNRTIIAVKIKPEYTSMLKIAGRINTSALIVRAGRAQLAAAFDDFKEIPFNNGMFNPETGEFKPHSPDNYNTTVCPTNLNLNAERFEPGERFFKEISCNDDAWINALFRSLGECLLYGNKIQKFFVWYGSGRNGKGVLLEWLCAALGGLIGECKATEISKNNPDNRQTTLFDTVSRCRILLFREAGGITYNDDLVKQLVGDNVITLNRIHLGSRSMPVCGTPILITNTLPTAEIGGISMKNRQIGFPFDMDLPDEKRDNNLLQKLATPAGNEWLVSKIVNTLIDGIKTGTNLTDCLPERVKGFTERMTNEADAVLMFLKECCVITGKETDRTDRTTLYKAFTGFEYSKEGRNPTKRIYWITPKNFGVRLDAHKLRPMQGRQRTSDGISTDTVRANVYPGILLNDDGRMFYKRMQESPGEWEVH